MEIDDYNEGCAVEYPTNNSYGPAFNYGGGGWCIVSDFFRFSCRLRLLCRYAMERTNEHINVWFWSRSDPFAPDDVTCGAPTIDTSRWVTAS